MDLGDNFTGVLIVMMCVLGPIWLSKHYKSKAMNAGRLSSEEVRALERMTQTAQLLEQRVVALEHILDAQVPAWRHDAALRGDLRGAAP